MLVKFLKIGEQIRLKDFSRKLRAKSLLKDIFIYEPGKNRFAVIFKYGVVAFWNFTEYSINNFIDKIEPFVDRKTDQICFEEIKVFPNKGEDAILAKGIALKDLDPRRLAIVSEIIGRSVALDSIEMGLEKMLGEFGEITADLAAKGRIFFSTKSLLKKVGFAMDIQHRIVSKMTVLDKPDITWEYGDISEFYSDLADEYEIQERYDVFKQKIEIIFRDIEFIMNYLDARKSFVLEWIIIGLIAIEIILFLPDLI